MLLRQHFCWIFAGCMQKKNNKKKHMLRNWFSLINSQMSPLNWFFYGLTFCRNSDLGSPFWYPFIPFFSIIPFVREVKERSQHEANDTLLVCEQALFTLIIVTLIIQTDEILRLLVEARSFVLSLWLKEESIRFFGLKVRRANRGLMNGALC